MPEYPSRIVGNQGLHAGRTQPSPAQLTVATITSSSSITSTVTVASSGSVVFDGGFETGSPAAYSPFGGVEAFNYGQPDTIHANFGNFFRDNTTASKGTYCGRTDLLGSSGYTAAGRTLSTDGYERGECRVTRAGGAAAALGTDDYYCLAHYFTVAPFGAQFVINQLGWTALGLGTSGPILVETTGTKMFFILEAGWAQNVAPAYQYNSSSGNGFPGGVPPNFDILPAGQLTLNVWHQFVFHVYWTAYDNQGVLECWHREKGQSTWTKTLDVQPGLCATMQYNRSTNALATFMQDKAGPYRKTQTTGISHYYEFARATSLAAAQAYFP